MEHDVGPVRPQDAEDLVGGLRDTVDGEVAHAAGEVANLVRENRVRIRVLRLDEKSQIHPGAARYAPFMTCPGLRRMVRRGAGETDVLDAVERVGSFEPQQRTAPRRHDGGAA